MKDHLLAIYVGATHLAYLSVSAL